jgi:polyferredoxin
VKRLRRVSQALFAILFLWLFLQTESKGANELGYPVKVFLDADPLLFLTTLFANRALPPALWLALGVAAATAILGRAFCGWVCPLGAFHDLAGLLKKTRTRQRALPQGLFRIKYYLLIALLASSLFTLQAAGIFDPLSLLIRSLAISVYPMFSSATASVFDAAYEAKLPFLSGISEAVYALLKKTLLPFQEGLYLGSVLVGVLFFLILVLNLVERRFWCRYLCPLGALLGLIGRRAIVRRSVSEGCNECGACEDGCHGGALPESKELWRIEECHLCGNCEDACPNDAVRFGLFPGKTAGRLDLGRRRLVTSFSAGLLSVPLLRVTPLSRAVAADPTLIRPPGATPEPEFLRRCVKCGECMKVCITGGLQPTFLQAGLEGIWSPVLIPRIGYCEHRCTLCGQVCPTGAIRNLPLEEKMEVRIGTAMIDKGRCLPFASATPCLVCEEVCPTSKKAIWLEEVRVKGRDGREILLRQPHVDLSLCIGCGICEARCPVLGRPAIYVSSVGETRSRDNRLLL